MAGGGATNIQVAVRVRPFLPYEIGSKSCIEVLPGPVGGENENDDDGPTITSSSWSSSNNRQRKRGNAVRIVSNVANKEAQTFTFDRCFGGSATQADVYGDLVRPLLSSCLEGYNATALAYGQTGAGELPRKIDFTLHIRSSCGMNSSTPFYPSL
jgi:hypothetical protein